MVMLSGVRLLTCGRIGHPEPAQAQRRQAPATGTLRSRRRTPAALPSAEQRRARRSTGMQEGQILPEHRLIDEPKTPKEPSQVYNVSRERVREIEVQAYEKLQKGIMRIAGERRLLPAAECCDKFLICNRNVTT